MYSVYNMYISTKEIEMKESFRLTELRSMPSIKRAAYKAPVLLTENGSPEFVFMTISDYQELEKATRSGKNDAK